MVSLPFQNLTSARKPLSIPRKYLDPRSQAPQLKNISVAIPCRIGGRGPFGQREIWLAFDTLWPKDNAATSKPFFVYCPPVLGRLDRARSMPSKFARHRTENKRRNRALRWALLPNRLLEIYAVVVPILVSGTEVKKTHGERRWLSYQNLSRRWKSPVAHPPEEGRSMENKLKTLAQGLRPCKDSWRGPRRRTNWRSKKIFRTFGRGSGRYQKRRDFLNRLADAIAGIAFGLKQREKCLETWAQAHIRIQQPLWGQ